MTTNNGIADHTDVARFLTPRPTCPHVTVRIPDPEGRVRYLTQCVRCDAILGWAKPGAAEPCLTVWRLEAGTEPDTPEDIAAMRAKFRREVA